MIGHNLVILTPGRSIQTCWSHNSVSVSKETLNIILSPHRRCGGLRLSPNPIPFHSLLRLHQLDQVTRETATRRILFEQGRIPEIEIDELTQETVRLEKSPFERAFYMEATKDEGYIYGTIMLWFINELTTTEITKRLDKKMSRNLTS